MEAQTANRTGILTGPYAFAFSVCHYRPKADFFIWHSGSLHRFQFIVDRANQQLASFDPRRLTGVRVYREIAHEFSEGVLAI